MAKQKENLTTWQYFVRSLGYCFISCTFIAFNIQFIIEPSFILKAYNWLLIFGGIVVFIEYTEKSSSNERPLKASKFLTFLAWIIGAVGVIICIIYYDYVDDVLHTFFSRNFN